MIMDNIIIIILSADILAMSLSLSLHIYYIEFEFAFIIMIPPQRRVHPRNNRLINVTVELFFSQPQPDGKKNIAMELLFFF